MGAGGVAFKAVEATGFAGAGAGVSGRLAGAAACSATLAAAFSRRLRGLSCFSVKAVMAGAMSRRKREPLNTP